MESLRQALHDEASGVPSLGDIDRAIDQVTTSRRRWAGVLGVAGAVVVLLTVLVGPAWQPVAVEPAAPQPGPTSMSARGAPASKLVDKIPTPAFGDFDLGIAVDPGTGRAFVAIGGGADLVSVVDTGTRKVIDTVTIPGWGNPYGIAVDPVAGEAYVTYPNVNRVAVVDTATREVVAEISVGRTPVPVAVDPAGRALYVGNQADRTVSVIDTTTRRVVATVAVVEAITAEMTETRPRGLAVDPRSGDVYVANGQADTVSVIDRDSRQVIETITGLDNPQAVAVDPSTGEAYLSSTEDDTVLVVDTRTRTVVDTIEGVDGPSGLAVDPTAGVVYVNTTGLAVIDTRTHKVIDTIEGSAGGGIAVDPTTGDVYVTNSDWGYTSVFGAS